MTVTPSSTTRDPATRVADHAHRVPVVRELPPEPVAIHDSRTC
jgi:hypothetical protein